MSKFPGVDYFKKGQEIPADKYQLTPEQLVALPHLYEAAVKGLTNIHNKAFQYNPGWLANELAQGQQQQPPQQPALTPAPVLEQPQAPEATVLSFEEAARRSVYAIHDQKQAGAINNELDDGQAAA